MPKEPLKPAEDPAQTENKPKFDPGPTHVGQAPLLQPKDCNWESALFAKM